MKRLNQEGVSLLGELPQPRELGPAELGRLARRDGGVAIDTRPDRSAFMARHLPGALYAPLDKTFNTVVGSLVTNPVAPLYPFVERERVEEAVRDLVRIGFDNIVGFAEPEAQERYFAQGGESELVEEIDFDQVKDLYGGEDAQVLDVRYASEHAAGSLPNALNVSYTRLAERLDEVPEDKTLVVHCEGGVRAAVASALLKRAGRKVRYINDTFANWSQGQEKETPTETSA